MHKTKSKLFFSVLITVIFGFFFSTFFCVAAYIKYLENSDGAFGSIGLRSYFHCGNGTEEDPYVITRPRHLYNLSKLQSLGVFSEKKYFQLGYDLDGNGSYEFYKGDETTETSPILDMTNVKNYKITNIGNEANPFYGEFEGMGLEIKGLTVYSDLEDSGLFGYVASRGVVKNLILDDVTIVCDGYSSSFDNMYSDDSDKSLKSSSSIIVKQGERTVSFSYDSNGKSSVSDNSGEVHDSTDTFSFKINHSSSQDDNTSKMPKFSFSFTDNNFNYSLLSSDVFFDESETSFTLKSESSDVSDIFSYFDSYKKENNTDVTYPLTLTQTMSLVASKLDEEGINHSKVVSALNVSFEKLNKDSTFITMYVQPRQTNHSNNMGLVIGHCDGSCLNVYVHNGTFKMNTNSDKRNDMRNVSQNSMTGFIGLIGPSVMNNASLESKGNVATSGKDVGVLDFTDIYNSVVDEFDSQEKTNGNTKYYTYVPKSDNEYMEYLRYYNNSDPSNLVKYSLKNNSIALIGQKVIKDDDNHNRGLGVFTLATDYREGGVGDKVFLNADSSNIIKSKFSTKTATGNTDKAPLLDSKNIFYSTFEYKKENYDNGIYDKTNDLFWVLKNSMSIYNTNDHFFTNGYHIPLESSVQSMNLYEAYYNYLFRFQLDEKRSDFYFSDLDSNSLGGKFLNNYFSNKLIDETGNPVEVGSSQFGLMIKDKKKKNIGQFTTCFPLDGSGKMYVLDKENPDQNKEPDPNNYVVSNSINFEIKTDYANVTILAGNENRAQGSLLGIYKLPSNLKRPDGQSAYVPYNDDKELSWDNPDYAMALMENNYINFFEYKTTNGIGKIGSAALSEEYFSDNQEVTENSNNLANKVNPDSKETTAIFSNPIFAHTFKLPKGRYCLGSACGKACVYYICAQGQDNGDLSLAANAFSNVNKVENMDFLKEDSQSATDEEKPYFSIENKEVTPNADNIQAKRCFLIFDSGNVSHFRASSKNNVNKFVLEMKYENGKFIFSVPDGSELTSIESLTLTNYGSLQNIGATQTVVNLFGTVWTDRKIVYKT